MQPDAYYFYLSFVQSTLEYARNAYVHSLRQHEYDSLTRISRRSLRTVFGYPSTADVQCILSRNNLTPITIRFSLLHCIFLYSDAFILLPAHFCAAFSAFVPILRHVAAPAQGLESRLDFYCHEPPLDLVIPLFLIWPLTAGTQFDVPALVRLAAPPSQFRIAILDWLGYPVRRP